ncbi:hypothetical protein HNP98_004017 [Hymenobacter sp. 9A]|uniref:Uncharacterized protein n=1 Tax=Hymenobacter caeli TaxID=2735894 RepID=A0ABX2FW25_9BACT|nr:hypothetical protein [Hymenobacter caeli]
MASSSITVDFLHLPTTPGTTRVQYGEKYRF